MEALSISGSSPHREVTSISLSGIDISLGSNEPPEEGSPPCKNPQMAGKVVRVIGDGRCLFRSLVTAMSWKLQIKRRNDYGRLECRNCAAEETSDADLLRASVVRLMFDNLHFYSQLEKGLINADQPVRVNYNKFKDRLAAMAKNSTMPGDLELNAAAMVLERQIIVLNRDLRVITVYGQERYPQSVPLAVRYTRLRPDLGHYDAVVLDNVNEFIKRGPGHADNCYGPHLQCLDLSKMAVRNNQELINTKQVNARISVSADQCYFSSCCSSPCTSSTFGPIFRQPCVSMSSVSHLGRKRWVVSRNVTHYRQSLYKSSRRDDRRKSQKGLKRTGYKVFWEYTIPPRLKAPTYVFCLGESQCVLCRKKILSSIYSWKKCYRCGRIAHSECVHKYTPCGFDKNNEQDFYFLCQLCVRRKIAESESLSS